MSREIILGALNGIRDEYIAEAAEALGLLGEAAPAYTKPAREHRENLLSRFFNSGWGVAVICAVVSLSVLGGIIWAGQRPPVGGPMGTNPSIETNAETSAETAAPLISEERAMEIASAYWNIRTGDVDPDTGYTFRIQSMGKTQTPKGVAVYEIALRWLVEDSRYSTVETVWVDVDTGDMIIPYESETGSETRYIQFPLIKPDDTTSFISLTDGGADKCKSLQFLVLPADTEKPKLTELFGIGFKSPTDGEVNVQIVSYKSETEYGFLYMYESAHLDLLNNRGETRVTMNCVRVEFFSKRTSTKPYYDIPAVDATLGVASFRYSPENKQSVLQSEYSNNYRALRHAEDLFEKYNDPEKYEYTILYSYVDGVEIINTPVESIPEFSYSIFKENAFDTQSPYPGQEEQETELIIPPENELYLSMLNNLRGTILTEGSNFTLPSTSMSGLASPYFVAAVTKPYADFTVTLGLDSNALETTLLFDHHRSQVVLTLHEDNSMTIRVLSKDNYEHEETIMPGAISEEPLFQDKNVSYSNTEHEYAPRYFLFYAMYYMDAFMGELNDEFSFEALGFTYADYQAYEHHLYS